MLARIFGAWVGSVLVIGLLGRSGTVLGFGFGATPARSTSFRQCAALTLKHPPPSLRMCARPPPALSPSLSAEREWLRRKGYLVPAVWRWLALWVVGLLGKIVLQCMNKFIVTRAENLHQFIDRRARGDRPLLTVSNHCSVFDDPGIWAALIPWWRMRPRDIRWSLCTSDIFFIHPFLTSLLAAGNVMPLNRMLGLDQDMLRLFQEQLNGGAWCHVFPEGKVMQPWRFQEQGECLLGKFQPGVGKLIAHCRHNPIVLPLYHCGMHQVAPEKVPSSGSKARAKGKLVSVFPQRGASIRVYVGKPLDLGSLIETWKREHPSEDLSRWESTPATKDLYATITATVRDAVLKLEAEAYGRVIETEKLAN